MNPILYYDAIYSLTKLKKQEDNSRQFIFDFITNNWREKLAEMVTEPKSFMAEESFINQLIKISNSGRNFKESEINDHIGTMIVAVSYIDNFFLYFNFFYCCEIGFANLWLLITSSNIKDLVIYTYKIY